MGDINHIASELLIDTLNNHNKNSKINLSIDEWMLRKSRDIDAKNNRENIYTEEIKYPRYRYEQEISKYIQDYSKAKTVYDKVRIKPPTKPKIDLDIFSSLV